MQKYLSPTDRDEIALTLNLSNAQVITWFQVGFMAELGKLGNEDKGICTHF